MIGKRCLAVLLAFFCVLSSVSVAQATLNMNASLNRSRISMGESVTLKVILTSTSSRDLPALDLPNLEAMFEISERYVEKGYQISIINGQSQTVRTETRRFVLSPLKEGRFTIDPIRLNVQGQSYQSQPLPITVAPAPAQTSPQAMAQRSSNTPSDPFQSFFRDTRQEKGRLFLHASTQRDQVYVGELLRYKLKLYRRVRLFSDIWVEPIEFEGAWVTESGLNKAEEAYVESVQNRQYWVEELAHSALFPIEAGPLTLREISAVVNVAGSLFSRQEALKANPVTVKVLPLPEQGKPDIFMGAVGEYEIRTHLSQHASKVNEPLSLRVVISGTGNLNAIQQLSFEESESLKVYQPKVTRTINATDQVAGSVEFEYVIIPKAPGVFSVPIFKLAYFNPKNETYHLLESDVLKVDVLGQAIQASSALPVNGKSLSIIQKDIRYIKSPIQAHSARLLSEQWWVQLLMVLLLGWSTALLVKAVKARFWRIDSASLKRQRAYSTANQALNHYLKRSEKSPDSVTQLERILFDYLSAKTGSVLFGAPVQQVNQILKKQRISDSQIQNLNQLMSQLSLASYAPSQSSNNTDHLANAVKGMIGILEKNRLGEPQ